MKTQKLLLVHGGPGLDDSYFYPYLNKLKFSFDMHSYTIGEMSHECSFEALIQELEHKIDDLDNSDLYLLGHSFGAALILSQNKKTIGKVKHIFLSNWIYDSAWIDEYFKNFPEERNKKLMTLKEGFISRIDQYFVDSCIGKHVLDKIQYRDTLFSKISPIFSNLDLKPKVKTFSKKITSISSDGDKITSQKYIDEICRTLEIPNNYIKNAGHFPFVEQSENFCEIILKTSRALQE